MKKTLEKTDIILDDIERWLSNLEDRNNHPMRIEK